MNKKTERLLKMVQEVNVKVGKYTKAMADTDDTLPAPANIIMKYVLAKMLQLEVNKIILDGKTYIDGKIEKGEMIVPNANVSEILQ